MPLTSWPEEMDCDSLRIFLSELMTPPLPDGRGVGVTRWDGNGISPSLSTVHWPPSPIVRRLAECNFLRNLLGLLLSLWSDHKGKTFTDSLCKLILCYYFKTICISRLAVHPRKTVSSPLFSDKSEGGTFDLSYKYRPTTGSLANPPWLSDFIDAVLFPRGRVTVSPCSWTLH